MKPYPQYKDSGIEAIDIIPNRWNFLKLNRVCYMKGRIGWQGLKQSEFADEGPYLITGMNFKNGRINWDEVYHIPEKRYEEAPEIHLQKDDVLLTKDGTIGKLLYVDYLPGKASLNSHLLVLRPLNNEFVPKYLYYQLDSILFKHHIELTKTGTTFFGITQESVGKYSFLNPSLPEQNQIAKYLDHKTAQIDSLIEKKKRLIELLKEERTAVINQAVTKGLDPDAPMKDSGIEWLGEIPAHWILTKLKHITNQIIDGTHLTPTYVEKGVPFLRVTDIQSPKIDMDKIKYIPETEHEILIKRCKPEKGDLLLSKNGTIGITKVIDWDFEFSIFVSLCLIKFVSNKLIPEYFMFIFESGVADEQIFKSSKKTSVTNLHLDKIREFLLIIPTVSEQKQIVKFLEKETSRIDSIISKSEKQIELLQEYRTALISEVVTGKIDVREERI